MRIPRLLFRYRNLWYSHYRSVFSPSSYSSPRCLCRDLRYGLWIDYGLRIEYELWMENRIASNIAVTLFIVPPIPLHGDFPCEVAKKFHVPSNPNLSYVGTRGVLLGNGVPHSFFRRHIVPPLFLGRKAYSHFIRKVLYIS